MTENVKKDNLPLDAKLLSEVIIELNISRRSVALYPKDHPITADSLNKAYNLLKKIFNIRPEITFGILKDTIIVDEYALDKKNPVFREFSLCLHERGIAAVTFYSNMTIDELFLFHELITSKDMHYCQALIDKAAEKGLRHIRLAPLEMSRLQFVENQFRKDSSEKTIEDYIYALLEGKLAEADEEGLILTTPPETIASIINDSLTEDSSENTYDRVITAYLREKGNEKIRGDLFKRFITFTENLKPDLKKQFLKRVFSVKIKPQDLNAAMRDLSVEDLERLLTLFQDHSSIIPDTLRNLINKLYETKGDIRLSEMIMGGIGVIHDIELNEEILKLFQEDHFGTYVPEDYTRQLDTMLQFSGPREKPISKEIEDSFRDGPIEKPLSEILLELTDLDSIKREEFLNILTRLSELVNLFVDTGRFEEISNVHNTLYSHTLSGRFKEEASSMINYFFRTEHFIMRLIEAFKLWGRFNREGILKLVRSMRLYLIVPLMNTITTEKDASIRELFLSILSEMGQDVADEAAKRLNNENADVLRDMIYLIRKCRGMRHTKEVRKFLSHRDIEVVIEALKTLLDFKTPDSVIRLKEFVRSNNPELRDRAIMLAGKYRLKELLPYLLRQLEKRDIIGTESYYKKTIVQAVAMIGDPIAIETLKKVYQTKSVLFRSYLEDLKVEIFKTLHKYPLDSVIPLAELGLKSKNKEIASISKKILEKAGKDVRD